VRSLFLDADKHPKLDDNGAESGEPSNQKKMKGTYDV